MNGSMTNHEPCAHCHLRPLEVAPGAVGTYSHVDPCLGIIPDVIQACCGHGYAERARCENAEEWHPEPYVVIAPGHPPGTWVPDAPNASELREAAALAFFAERGVGPDAVKP